MAKKKKAPAAPPLRCFAGTRIAIIGGNLGQRKIWAAKTGCVSIDAAPEIVVVADDSGSMGAVANYVTRSTRWTELRDTLQKLAHMLLVVDHTDGFHIQFLNDPT